MERTEMSTNGTLRPGSTEAREKGCTCPILDNHYGRGRGGEGEKYGWWIVQDCPLHGGPAEEISLAPEDPHGVSEEREDR